MWDDLGAPHIVQNHPCLIIYDHFGAGDNLIQTEKELKHGDLHEENYLQRCDLVS